MKKVGVVLVAFLLIFSSQAFAKKTKTKTAPKVVKEVAKATEEPAPASQDGKVLHSFSRLISFDPHPTDIDPLENSTVDFNGKKISYKVQILEGWDTNGKAPNLKELGFKVVLISDGKEVKAFDFPKKTIGEKGQKKGFVLGNEKAENLGVNIKVDEVSKEGKAVTGLAVAVSLLGFDATGTTEPSESETPEPTTPPLGEPPASVSGTPPLGEPPASGLGSHPTSEPAAATVPKPASGIPASSLNTALKVALEIAKKADELESAKTAAKILLYKKAISSLGAAAGAVENAEFVSEIQGKISQLGGKTQRTVSEKPSDDKTSPSENPVSKKGTNPEAMKLLDDAKILLATGKEPEARDLLRKAVEKDPNFHAAWLQLGKNAFGNSKYAKAKEAFEKCLGLKDDDIETSVLYFKSCYYLGETETGLEKLRGLAKKFPEKIQARMALAEGYFQAGDFTSCEEECVNISAKFQMDDRLRDLTAKVKEKTR